jgi:hypothetical protein
MAKTIISKFEWENDTTRKAAPCKGCGQLTQAIGNGKPMCLPCTIAQSRMDRTNEQAIVRKDKKC